MPDAPRILPVTPKHAAAPRKTTAERGYGTAHQRQRARLLRRNPICQRCGQDWARHLHHRDRNTFNRADANAEMLCEKCHQREHGRG